MVNSMVKEKGIERVLTKYVILLLVYIVVVRFIQPYGLKLYYSIAENPMASQDSIHIIQSIMTLISFVINLIFVSFMIIDSKGKKLVDWLIIIITFFSPEAGIPIFIVWQIYKKMINTRHNRLV